MTATFAGLALEHINVALLGTFQDFARSGKLFALLAIFAPLIRLGGSWAYAKEAVASSGFACSFKVHLAFLITRTLISPPDVGADSLRYSKLGNLEITECVQFLIRCGD